MTERLSLSQARRIALHAQQLAGVRPTGPATARAVGRTFARLELVQIDSVNVLVRSHYLPFFSRLGPYDRTILNRLSGAAPRSMIEYWAHEASLIRPLHFHDLRAWQNRTWVGAARLDPQLRAALEERILAVLAHSRPLTARQVAARIGHREAISRDDWGWNWSAVKRTLEDLFERGVLSAASRNEQFERRYAPTGKVLPPDVPADTEVDPRDALRRLVAAAAAAHGIGTVRCFADYFRLPVAPAAAAVADLVTEQVLVPVEVAGWNGPIYRHAEAHLVRRARGRALLSPFDSLVFERRRLEQLFGFRYRLEIYVPESRRVHGYYVLPFLLGEVLAARVDLKADRANGRLLVRGAFAEPGAPAHTAAELAEELTLLAHWLELSDVVVLPHGDLAAALAAQYGPRPARAGPPASHVD